MTATLFLLLPAATTTAPVDLPRLVGLVVLGVLGWRLLALWLFPYAPCRHCRGTGRRIRLGRRLWNWTRTTDTAAR
ncbi:MAG: hypothetical protein LC799_36130 [Actinobacteria bacterium]|nr:hypothetical protein [Actinomycetota bacterium]